MALWGAAGSDSSSDDAPPGIDMLLGLRKYRSLQPEDLCRQIFLYNFLYNVWRLELVWRQMDGIHLPQPLYYLEAG